MTSEGPYDVLRGLGFRASADQIRALIEHATKSRISHVELIERLAGRLAGLGERHACVVDVRGRGLMWGVELAADRDVPAVIEALRARGVLAALAGPTVVRFVPPLVVTRAELDEGVDALDAVLAAGAGAPS